MARKFFGWTTTHFKHGRPYRINRYRRYGKKTYRIFSAYIPKLASKKRFNDYV